jgi:hypothetical protein
VTPSSASSTAVADGWPRSSAKATVTTSLEPNSAPRQIAASTIGSSQRHRRGGRPPSSSWPSGTGCVERREANHSPPTSAHTTTVPIPARSDTWVASRVTTTGPTMKIASSTTASKA